MKHVPNLLTLTRIVALPLFALAIYYDSNLFRFILLIMFISLAITDFLDGFIARKYNIESSFGRILDPIADKIIFTVITIILVARDPLLAKYIIIPIILIISREFAVSGLREYLAKNHSFSMPPTFMAKSKTTIQLISLGFLIIGTNISIFSININTFIIGITLFWISGIITVITGYQYISQGVKIILSNENKIV